MNAETLRFKSHCKLSTNIPAHYERYIDIHKAQEKFIVLELHLHPHPGLELTTCGTHSRSNELPQCKPLGYLAI